MEALREWIKILLSISCGNSANYHSFEMMEEREPKMHLDVLV
jgi:hypothetical protein